MTKKGTSVAVGVIVGVGGIRVGVGATAVAVGVVVGTKDCTIEHPVNREPEKAHTNKNRRNFLFMKSLGEITYLQPWQEDGLLILIFALSVGIRDVTNFIAAKEQHLGNAFV